MAHERLGFTKSFKIRIKITCRENLFYPDELMMAAHEGFEPEFSTPPMIFNF